MQLMLMYNLGWKSDSNLGHNKICISNFIFKFLTSAAAAAAAEHSEKKLKSILPLHMNKKGESDFSFLFLK